MVKMYPYGLSWDNIQSICDAFRVEVDNKPCQDRWVYDHAIAGLRRQKPVHHVAIRSHQELPDRGKDGAWLLEGSDGIIREIIPAELLVDRVMSEFDDRYDKYSFLKEFSYHYEGVLIEDLSFIFAQVDKLSVAASMLSLCTGARVDQSPARLSQDLVASWKEGVSDSAQLKSESLYGAEEVPPLVLSTSELANVQQEALLHGLKANSLIANYNKIRATESDSHLKKHSELALDILTNGLPARCWTPGDNPSSLHEADYLLLNEEQHMEMARTGKTEHILKPIVVRDEQFRRRRNTLSRNSLFEELLKCPPWKHVHVQQLGEGVDKIAVKAIPVREAVQIWRASPQEFSDDHPPLNMLNLSNSRDGLWLSGLYKEYDMLSKAFAFSDEEMLFHLKSAEAGKGTIGKETVEFWGAADIKNCRQFMILAQRGAVSAYHIDNIGVWTFVTLEGNTNDPQEQDEDVLKFWPIFPLQKLSEEDQVKYLNELGSEGTTWRPVLPSGVKVPVLSLVRGDTLIMPPGTVHAPITATDCLFVGGMCMHPKFVKRSVEIWHYLHKNPNATNEPKPRQTRAIIDYIKSMVHSDPGKHGFTSDELVKFDKDCAEISNASLSCRCVGGCKTTNCNCVKYGQRCAAGCHPLQSCKNPFGCQSE